MTDGHLTITETLCSEDIELLAVSMRSYYLPQEFTHVCPPRLLLQPVMDNIAGCSNSL